MVASDGVWDVMSPSEVVGFVMDLASEGKTAPQAAAALVRHAVELGLASPGGSHDNTSAAVVWL